MIVYPTSLSTKFSLTGSFKKPVRSSYIGHAAKVINIFIANVWSKFSLAMFTNFHASLKH